VACAFVLMAFEWSTVNFKESLEANNETDICTMPFKEPDEILYIKDPVVKTKVEDFNTEIIVVTEVITEITEEKKDEKDVELIVPPLDGKLFEYPSD
jgi:hypothetical protein